MFQRIEPPKCQSGSHPARARNTRALLVVTRQDLGVGPGREIALSFRVPRLHLICRVDVDLGDVRQVCRARARGHLSVRYLLVFVMWRLK